MGKKRSLFAVIFTIIIIGFIIYSAYSYVKGNIEKITISILKDNFGLNTEFTNIKFGMREDITLSDFVFRDKTGKVVLFKGKSLVLKYNLSRLMFGDKRISSIILNDGEINLEVKKGYKINIMEAVAGGPQKEYSAPVIERIYIKNSIVNYTDSGKKITVNRDLYSVNGEVFFNDDTRRVELEAKGFSKFKEKKEEYEIKISASMEKVSYTLEFNLRNIPVNGETMQYGYINKDLQYNSGVVDVNVIVDEKLNVRGKVSLKNGNMNYRAYKGDIKNIAGIVFLEGRKIRIIAAGEVYGKKIRFGLETKDFQNLNKVNTTISISGREFDYSLLEKYKNIGDIKFPVRGLIKSAEAKINITHDMVITIDASGEAGEFYFYNEKIDGGRAKLSSVLKVDKKTGKVLTLGINPWEIKDGYLKYYTGDVYLDGKVYDKERFNIALKVRNISLEKYVADFQKKTGIVIKGNAEFDGNVEYKKVTGNYTVNFETENIKQKKAVGSFVYQYLPKIAEGNFDSNSEFGGIFYYDFINKRIKLDLDIKKNSWIQYMGGEGLVRGKTKLDLDLIKSNVNSADINLLLSDIKYSNKDIKKIELDYGELECSGDGKKLIFNNFMVNQNDSFIRLNGNFNPGSFKYSFNVVESNIKPDAIDILNSSITESVYQGDKSISNLKYLVPMKLSGTISGEKDKFEFTAGIKSGSGKIEAKYNGSQLNAAYENISTTISGKIKRDDLEITADGTIGKIAVIDEEAENIGFSVKYTGNGKKSGNLKINRININEAELAGIYDIAAKNMNITALIKDFDSEKYKYFKKNQIKVYMENAEVKITGNISAPVITAKYKDLSLRYNKIVSAPVKSSGEISYKTGIINLINCKVDDNTLNGSFDISNKSVDLKLNIFENNFKRYYTNPYLAKINARIIGEVNIWGGISDFDIDDIKATANVTVDNIYYGNTKIPSITTKFSFGRKKIGISRLNILGSDIAEGYIDLQKEEFDLSLKETELDFDKISFIEGISGMKGKIKFHGGIRGKFLNPEYNASIESKKVSYNAYTFENLSGSINGNINSLNVKELKLNFNDNPVLIKGSIDTKLKNYDIKINSNNFDLSFINIFTKKYVKDLKGKASINLALKGTDLTGDIELKNVGLKQEENNILLNNIDGRITLIPGRVILSSLNGNLNGGKFVSSGYLDYTGFLTPKDLYMENQLWDVRISYNKYVDILCDANIKIAKKNVAGNIIVKKGTGFIALNEKKSTDALEKTGIEKTKKEAVSKQEKEIKDFINEFTANVKVELKRDLKVSMGKVTSLLENVESGIEGNLNISAEKGRVNILGTVSTYNGVLRFNNNDFKIETGILTFDNAGQYLPDIYPSIAVKATTTVAGEDVYVQIGGDLKNSLTPKLYGWSKTENRELKNEEILSLLTLRKRIDSAAPDLVVRNIFDSQLSRQIIDPISERIKELFGLEVFAIKTDIFDTEKMSTRDPLLGANFELGGPLFGDKLFWNADVSLSDTVRGDVSNFNGKIKYKMSEELSPFVGIETKGKKEDNKSDDLLKQLNIGLNFKGKF